MDEQILKTVHSILGENINIVDCEKSSSIVQEEVLFINGVKVKLDNSEISDAIKTALISGTVPSDDLLNQFFIKAGIICAPVELETSLSVKSSIVVSEDISVSRNGKIIDERFIETTEDNQYTSVNKGEWVIGLFLLIAWHSFPSFISSII